MSLLVLDLVLWIFGIRGHIPQNDGFRTGRVQASVADHGAVAIRVLAAAALCVGFLSLALWAAVWLAIKWL
jgi:hypothetical protein